MKWTLINPAGTNDPDTGDIYSGLDRFGRVKDNRWLDGAGDDLDTYPVRLRPGRQPDLAQERRRGRARLGSRIDSYECVLS
jgi:hypothetical protein